MDSPKHNIYPGIAEKENRSHREILSDAGILLKRIFGLCPDNIDRRIVIPGFLEDKQRFIRGRCLTKLNSEVDFTMTRQGEENNDMTEIMIHVHPGDIPMTDLFTGIEQGLSSEWIMKHKPSTSFRGKEVRKYLQNRSITDVDLISIKLLFNGANAKNRRSQHRLSPVAIEMSLDMADDSRITFDPLIAYNEIQEQRGLYSRIMYNRVIGILEDIVSREELFKLQDTLRTAFGKIDIFKPANPQNSHPDSNKDPKSLN